MSKTLYGHLAEFYDLGLGCLGEWIGIIEVTVICVVVTGGGVSGRQGDVGGCRKTRTGLYSVYWGSWDCVFALQGLSGY